jgi:putative flippase GtrA
VATSADWAVITVTVLIHGHYLLAVFLGSLTGACFDFGIKRRWVFDARGGSPTVQVGRYGAVSLISLALNESLSWVAVGLLHQPKVLGPLVVSIVVGTLWNYPLQRRFVFHHTTRPAALREGAL